MRRKGHGHACGYAAICAGTVIVLALVLPAWFWWLAGAALLICGGVWLLRC